VRRVPDPLQGPRAGAEQIRAFYSPVRPLPLASRPRLTSGKESAASGAPTGSEPFMPEEEDDGADYAVREPDCYARLRSSSDFPIRPRALRGSPWLGASEAAADQRLAVRPGRGRSVLMRRNLGSSTALPPLRPPADERRHAMISLSSRSPPRPVARTRAAAPSRPDRAAPGGPPRRAAPGDAPTRDRDAAGVARAAAVGLQPRHHRGRRDDGTTAARRSRRCTLRARGTWRWTRGRRASSRSTTCRAPSTGRC